jgi:hypothetical protein
MKACCVLGSKSQTRCLGIQPSGETAIPMPKINHPQRTMSMLDACAATVRSIEKGARIWVTEKLVLLFYGSVFVLAVPRHASSYRPFNYTLCA